MMRQVQKFGVADDITTLFVFIQNGHFVGERVTYLASSIRLPGTRSLFRLIVHYLVGQSANLVNVFSVSMLRKVALDVILNGLVLEHAYDPERISEKQVVSLLERLFDVLIQPKQMDGLKQTDGASGH